MFLLFIRDNSFTDWETYDKNTAQSLKVDQKWK